jgi:hypothetical protein
VQRSPFHDEAQSARADLPFEHGEILDGDQDFPSSIYRVEMRWSMLPIVHVDRDSEELRDPGHGWFFGTLMLMYAVIPSLREICSSAELRISHFVRDDNPSQSL